MSGELLEFRAGSIAEHLREMAAQSFNTAFKMNSAATSTFELCQVAIHAGSAVEFACKAIIAARSSALLLDRRDQYRWDHPAISRETRDALDSWRDVMTLSAKTSVLVASDMLDQDINSSSLPLTAARNRAIHMGIPPDSTADILDAAGRWLRQLEGKFMNSVSEILDPEAGLVYSARFNETRAELKDAILAARERFRRLHQSVGSRKIDEIVHKRSKKKFEDVFTGDNLEYIEPVGCPACGSTAVLESDVIGMEYEYEGPGEAPSESPIWGFTLLCGVCSLTLSDSLLDALDERLESRLDELDDLLS